MPLAGVGVESSTDEGRSQWHQKLDLVAIFGSGVPERSAPFRPVNPPSQFARFGATERAVWGPQTVTPIAIRALQKKGGPHKSGLGSSVDED